MSFILYTIYKGGNIIRFDDQTANRCITSRSIGLKCFEEILAHPSIRDQTPYPYVLYSKGRTLGKLRRYQEAIDDFKGAYDAFNANAEVSITNVANTLRNKGYAHAMLDELEDAYESLGR